MCVYVRGCVLVCVCAFVLVRSSPRCVMSLSVCIIVCSRSYCHKQCFHLNVRLVFWPPFFPCHIWWVSVTLSMHSHACFWKTFNKMERMHVSLLFFYFIVVIKNTASRCHCKVSLFFYVLTFWKKTLGGIATGGNASWVSRRPWARRLTLTCPDELAVVFHGWHRQCVNACVNYRQ